MHKTLSTLLVAFAVVAVSSFPADPASAYAGYAYVGSVEQSMYSGNYNGTHGYARVTLYSQPARQGTYHGAMYIWSKGTTNPNASPVYLYSELQLMTAVQNLLKAASEGIRVYIYDCGATSTNPAVCIRDVAYSP